MSRRKPKQNSAKKPAAPFSRRKLWCFRLMAVAGVPLLLFGLLELGLRLAGFGYPTAFLLKSSNHGENTLSLIHISEPTRLGMISYAVFCLKKKKKKKKN